MLNQFPEQSSACGVSSSAFLGHFWLSTARRHRRPGFLHLHVKPPDGREDVASVVGAVNACTAPRVRVHLLPQKVRAHGAFALHVDLATRVTPETRREAVVGGFRQLACVRVCAVEAARCRQARATQCCTLLNTTPREIESPPCLREHWLHQPTRAFPRTKCAIWYVYVAGLSIISTTRVPSWIQSADGHLPYL